MQKCNGVKILDLEDKPELVGNEYLVTAEKGENYKIPLNQVTDAIINSSKFKAAVSEVYESSVPTASVTLEKDQFLFSFGIPAGRLGDPGKNGKDGVDGKDGKDGIDGVPGIDGDTTRLVIAFKSTETDSKPDTPVGGSWDYATNVVTYPDGWYGSDNNLDGYLWMSNATFSSNGTIVVPWSDPVPFSGRDGRDGVDGTSIQFVYKLTITYLAKPNPDHPTGSQEDAIRQGWTDHPTGISEQYQCEWVSSRTLQDDGTWSEWSPCTIWSKWGVNGKDGDGVEYIFQRTILPIPPHNITDNNPDIDEYIPQSYPGEQPWTDDPSGVSESFKCEWVSQRKYKGNTHKWGDFSAPSLWAKWGDDGQDGLHLRVMYTKTAGSDIKPADPDRLSINPGSIWSKAMPTADGKEAIWGIQALVDFDNNIVIDENLPEEERGWQGPYLITGVPGLDGNNYNYNVDVFKEGSVQPQPPIGNDPYNPGDGWVTLPDSSSGIWWKCTGLVNGVTGLVIEWGAVIKVTGQGIVVKGLLDSTDQLPTSGNEIGDAYIIDGDLWTWDGEQWVYAGKAQGPNGNYTEIRFAKNDSYSNPPSLVKTDRYPSGWLTGAANSSSGSVTWMTSALISGTDNTLLGDGWEDPWYITGATGSAGVSGIPGVSYELRYCKGTATEYSATWNSTVRTTRDPLSYGWSMDLPTVDNTNKYIWFIQARIGYNNNDDKTGYLEDGYWEAPHLLSGINGLEPGGDSPIIYPAGVYSTDVTYINDTSTAPYVWDPNGGAFYVLDTPMTWLGTEQGNRYPSDENVTAWIRFEMFDAMFADFGIINNALIGGAVFNNLRMFSQAGIDSSGAPNAHYERLSPGDTTEEIMNGSKNFTPNFLLDFETGEAYFNTGNIHLAAGDESSIKLKNDSYETTLDKSGLSVRNWTADIGGDILNISGQGIFVSMPVEGADNLRRTYFRVNANGAELYTQDTTDTTLPLDFNLVQHFKFNADGSGELANGNISWTSDGTLTVNAIITDVEVNDDAFTIIFPNTNGAKRTFFVETGPYTRSYMGHTISGSADSVVFYPLPSTYNGSRSAINSSNGTINLPADSVFSVTNLYGNNNWTITQIACRDAI